jgi:hypothetical protein
LIIDVIRLEYKAMESTIFLIKTSWDRLSLGFDEGEGDSETGSQMGDTMGGATDGWRVSDSESTSEVHDST